MSLLFELSIFLIIALEDVSDTHHLLQFFSLTKDKIMRWIYPPLLLWLLTSFCIFLFSIVLKYSAVFLFPLWVMDISIHVFILRLFIFILTLYETKWVFMLIQVVLLVLRLAFWRNIKLRKSRLCSWVLGESHLLCSVALSVLFLESFQLLPLFL